MSHICIVAVTSALDTLSTRTNVLAAANQFDHINISLNHRAAAVEGDADVVFQSLWDKLLNYFRSRALYISCYMAAHIPSAV
jgi:hypothetical protein